MAKEYFLSDVIDDPVFSRTALFYQSNQCLPQLAQELKGGRISWEHTLDLRGQDSESIRQSLIQFIKLDNIHSEHCVLVLFAKELDPKRPPLIKNYLNTWLRQFKEVIAFSSASLEHPAHESVYVLIKKAKPLPEVQAAQTTYLIVETKDMERNRRLNEQQGERQLAAVKARYHAPEQINHVPEGELQNTMLQHPELDSQRFDGVDTNLNPDPPLNSAARTEFDNERREQEMEKQLRLGNMPKFSSAPTPKGP